MSLIKDTAKVFALIWSLTMLALLCSWVYERCAADPVLTHVVCEVAAGCVAMGLMLLALARMGRKSTELPPD